VYEAFYRFREKPFSILPDPSFLYLSPKHSMALALLEYGLMNQAGFNVITGEIGTGKTTLIRYLLSQLDKDVTVGLISNTHRSFGELLQWILFAFNLEHRGKEKVERYKNDAGFFQKLRASVRLRYAEEIDYRYEATSITRMRKILRKHKLYVHKVFHEYSTRRVLVTSSLRRPSADVLDPLESDRFVEATSRVTVVDAETEGRVSLSNARLDEFNEEPSSDPLVPPGRDEKILTSWNGLMIAALANSDTVIFGRGNLEAAQQAMQYLLKKLRSPEGRFLRTCGDDHPAKLTGYLEDYAYVIEALLVLYEADFDAKWISKEEVCAGVDAAKARTGWFQNRHLYKCTLEAFKHGNHPVYSR
jgi:hypothetical protein